VPRHPATPWSFLIAIIAVLTLLAAENPRRSSLGLGDVALGLEAYQLASRRGILTVTLANLSNTQ
jgi:hypothetical protein